ETMTFRPVPWEISVHESTLHLFQLVDQIASLGAQPAFNRLPRGRFQPFVPESVRRHGVEPAKNKTIEPESVEDQATPWPRRICAEIGIGLS
ncbi:MAG: hypothetical protein NT069_18410, partial [Planctomycetota bacterium]|nr:hypothetical protein [Planctomycetota bacterium]